MPDARVAGASSGREQAFSIERLRAWDGFAPHWVEADGSYWLSRREKIFRAASLGAKPEYCASVPAPSLKSLISRLPYAERALRFSVYNIVPRPDGSVFVTFGRSFYTYHDGHWTEVTGTVRPCRVLRGTAAVVPSGDIYFGEYFDNPDRSDEVHVFRIPAGSSEAECVHTFQPGEVRHVHGLHFDPIGQSVWLLTGDLPNECRILETADGFQSVQTVGAGDESWRGISPCFRRDAIFYATDAQFEQNYIYRIDRACRERTPVTEIDGPSYYSAQFGNHVVFCTTAELCPSQKEGSAAMWLVDPAGSANAVGSWQKDLFRSHRLADIFQYGIIQLPYGNLSDAALPFTGTGLRGLNRRMFVLKFV